VFASLRSYYVHAGRNYAESSKNILVAVSKRQGELLNVEVVVHVFCRFIRLVYERHRYLDQLQRLVRASLLAAIASKHRSRVYRQGQTAAQGRTTQQINGSSFSWSGIGCFPFVLSTACPA
jgi:hypothetical protein